MSHQKFPLLLPVVALRVGGHVGLRHHADQVPLLLGGLLPVQHRLLPLLLTTPLTVLLDELPLGEPLAVVQHQVGGHSHCDALLEAAFLALVAGHFVDDALPLVLTGVGRVEVLLDRPPEETLATLAGDAAIVVARGFVPAHDAQLILV